MIEIDGLTLNFEQISKLKELQDQKKKISELQEYKTGCLSCELSKLEEIKQELFQLL